MELHMEFFLDWLVIPHIFIFIFYLFILFLKKGKNHVLIIITLCIIITMLPTRYFF